MARKIKKSGLSYVNPLILQALTHMMQTSGHDCRELEVTLGWADVTEEEMLILFYSKNSDLRDFVLGRGPLMERLPSLSQRLVAATNRYEDEILFAKEAN